MIINEIAPNLFRICAYAPDLDLQFNTFLVCDEQPVLFGAGLHALFPHLREAVAMLVEPAKLRWVAFSHFEADECGALNDWLEMAPQAEPLCGEPCAIVNINDWALRPARSLAHGEVLVTGRYRFRYLSMPGLLHAWDAGLLFEEVGRVLLCSDLFFQYGNPPPVTNDLIEATTKSRLDCRPNSFAGMGQLGGTSHQQLEVLAKLDPHVIAVGHGASFIGDGAAALRQLAKVTSM